MKLLRDQVTRGMAVLDAHAAPVGHVQAIHDGVLLVRLQLEIPVPMDVIQEVRDDQVMLAVQRDAWLPLLQGVEEMRPPEARGTVCCACGAMAGRDKAVPYLRKQDAWFCADCWQALPMAAVERVVQEVALRGVPL